MLLKRCPSCRSLWDAERYSVCFGCGAALGDKAVPVSAPTPAPELLRTTRQDRRSTSAALLVFAIIGGIGLLGGFSLQGIPVEVKFGLGAILVAGLLLGAWSETRRSGTGSAGRIVMKGLALAGLVIGVFCCAIFGLVVLLFAACSLGMMR
jgi:hypothetical protein